jgi:YHS domain-containing protein
MIYEIRVKEKMATIDPVCKMEIDENSKFRSKVEGKEFSFCCQQCKSIFEKTHQNTARFNVE